MCRPLLTSPRLHAETPAAQVVDIVNISDPKGWTCLLCAAQHDMQQIAALLLPLGAAVHASLHASGNTAAHIAALKGEDGMPFMA
jgi:ankyrin repeat protein